MQGRRILVATDLSEYAQPAARAAQSLAELIDAEIVAVHSVDLSLWRNRNAKDIWKDEALEAKVKKAVRHWFVEARVREPARVIVDTGHPERVIRAVIDEDGGFDYLVVALSGRGAWSKLIFGSTALGLTNPPPCKMVVTHPDSYRLSAGMTIAVGVDFSPASAAALKEAARLARQVAGELHVVTSHLLPTITVVAEDLPEGLEPTTVVNWAEESMGRFIQENQEVLKGLKVRTAVVTEAPVRGLRQYVQQKGVELLVLGHRSSAERRGSSSVKGKWVQQANCSTLLIPTRE